MRFFKTQYNTKEVIKSLNEWSAYITEQEGSLLIRNFDEYDFTISYYSSDRMPYSLSIYKKSYGKEISTEKFQTKIGMNTEILRKLKIVRK